MKYYRIILELGHAGRGKSISTTVYFKAKNILSALTKARNLPGVKHTKLPPKISEITEEEYLEGIQQHDYYKKMNHGYEYVSD